MELDPNTLRPIAIQKTLLLVNTFVISTVEFLNSFVDNCEKRLCHVSSRISEMETILQILDTKLNSIPSLDYSSNDLPASASRTTDMSSQPSSNDQSQQNASDSNNQSGSKAPPPPPPPSGNPEPVMPAGMIAAKDHPAIYAIFKLLRVGVPEGIVRSKLQDKGFDPDLVSTADKLIPFDESNDLSQAVVPYEDQTST